MGGCLNLFCKPIDDFCIENENALHLHHIDIDSYLSYFNKEAVEYKSESFEGMIITEAGITNGFSNIDAIHDLTESKQVHDRRRRAFMNAFKIDGEDDKYDFTKMMSIFFIMSSDGREVTLDQLLRLYFSDQKVIRK